MPTSCHKPTARLHGALSVACGLKVTSGGMVASLAGEKETIQTLVELVAAEDYESARMRLLVESRQRGSQSTIYLLGRTAAEINDHVAEIYRSREIVNRYRSAPEQEVKEYCAAQTERANKLGSDLEHLLKNCLGERLFHFSRPGDGRRKPGAKSVGGRQKAPGQRGRTGV